MDGTCRKTQYKHMNRGRKRRDIKQPRRERILVTGALKRLGLRYWEMVEIINPNFTNQKGEVIGGQQWIDFIVVDQNRKLFAIEFYPKWGKHNPHQFHKRWMNEKKEFLAKRDIPTLILSRNETEQDYWGRIYIFLHSGGRHHGSR